MNNCVERGHSAPHTLLRTDLARPCAVELALERLLQLLRPLLRLQPQIRLVPLVRLRGIAPEDVRYPPEMAKLRPFMPPYHGVTVIAVNVGGCIVPVLFSMYLLTQSEIALTQIFLAVITLTAVSYAVARPMPGVGIGMPMLVAPAAAVVAGLIFGGEERALTAYVAGTTGVLVGADLLRINDIRQLGTPLASIGGAGTFDGIFFTGIIAVLLA